MMDTYGTKYVPTAVFSLVSCLQVDGGDPQRHVLRQPPAAEHQERTLLMNGPPSALRLPGEDLNTRLHKHQTKTLIIIL